MDPKQQIDWNFVQSRVITSQNPLFKLVMLSFNWKWYSIFRSERFSYNTGILISVHANCIYTIYAELGGLVVWYLKRRPGFNSQPGLVLSAVNSFLIKHVHIFALINVCIEYQIRKYHAQLCRISSATFLQCFHPFMLIWPFQEKSHF